MGERREDKRKNEKKTRTSTHSDGAYQMAQNEEIHPFQEALPPTTDYITYLTLLEYNLARTNVAILQTILETDVAADESALIINIGWDLVALLLPLLPESRECLLLIARYGNPREVVLKVAEALEAVDWEEDEHDDNEESEHEVKGSDQAVHPVLRSQEAQPKLDRPDHDELCLQQITTLTTMLGILHPRIRTNKPSRFAATALPTVLSAFGNTPSAHKPALIEPLIQLAKALSPRTKPALPPRAPPTATNGSTQPAVSKPKAPDPEADTSASTGTDDAAIQKRLLLAFATHIAALYAGSVGESADMDEVPGLAWAPRELEKFQPGHTVPGRSTWAHRFETEAELMQRQQCTLTLLKAAQDLGVTRDALLDGAGVDNVSLDDDDEQPESEEQSLPENWQWNEDLLPSSASEILLSPLGSLHLLVAWDFTGSGAPSSSTSSTSPEPLTVFPHHARLLHHHITNPTTTNNTPHVDALLAPAIRALNHNALTPSTATSEPSIKTTTTYLRFTATLSATSSSSSLRLAAHVLTTTVLRSHPSPALRLAFIRSVLEESPYPNLRVSAVGWLKGCIVDANVDLFVAPHLHGHGCDHASNAETNEGESDSLFSTPLPLTLLAPKLFEPLPLPPNMNTTTPQSQASLIAHYTTSISPNIPYTLAVLNFYYFLLRAPRPLRSRLDLGELYSEGKAGMWLEELGEVVRVFGRGMAGGESGDSDDVGVKAELGILENTIQRVQEAIVNI